MSAELGVPLAEALNDIATEHGKIGGAAQARRGGELIAGAGFTPDVMFTSVLKRAIRTLWIAGLLLMPVAGEAPAGTADPPRPEAVSALADRFSWRANGAALAEHYDRLTA